MAIVASKSWKIFGINLFSTKETTNDQKHNCSKQSRENSETIISFGLLGWLNAIGFGDGCWLLRWSANAWCREAILTISEIGGIDSISISPKPSHWKTCRNSVKSKITVWALTLSLLTLAQSVSKNTLAQLFSPDRWMEMIVILQSASNRSSTCFLMTSFKNWFGLPWRAACWKFALHSGHRCFKIFSVNNLSSKSNFLVKNDKY